MRWAARSHAHYYRDASRPGGLFGIVQGGMYTTLRLASLEALLRLRLAGLGGRRTGGGRARGGAAAGPRERRAAHAGATARAT